MKPVEYEADIVSQLRPKKRKDEMKIHDIHEVFPKSHQEKYPKSLMKRAPNESLW